MMRLPAILFVTLCVNQCLAHGFNVDLQDAQGVPSQSYAANGQSGFWNSINFADASGFGQGPPIPLRNINDEPTSVTLHLFQQASFSLVNNSPGFGGDDAALLADGWGTTDIPMNITLDGLSPGQYQVTLYGLVGDGTGGYLTGLGGDLSGTMGGTAWSGAFVEGQTHRSQVVNAADGSIEFYWAAAQFGYSSAVTGLQVQHIPEPSSIVLLALGLLGMGWQGWRRRKRA